MKKLLSMILVLAMLCTMLALASCGDDTADTSSEATSSEESVAPPTNAELFEAAAESLDTTYLTPFANVFAIDLEKFESETGNANITLSVDELSAMGENMFGEDPLKIGMDMSIGKESTKAESVLYAAGDEVKFELYTKGEKQYIIFPELYADTVFDYADVTASEDTEETEPEAEVPSLMTVLEDITALLLKEENITISEDGKTYTVTLGKADVEAMLDLIEPLMGITDGMDDIIDLGGTSEEPVETPAPDSAVYVLNLASDTQASLSLTFKEGETILSETTVNCSALSGMTSITVKTTAFDAEVFDLTMSATASAVSVEGEMNMNGTIVELTLNAENANGACTIDGTLSLTVDMSGMLLTIPFEINGTFAVEGETLSMALTLSASIEDMMDIGLSVEMDFTPGDVTVTLPFEESDVAEYNAEEFNAKLAEVYPNAAALLGGSTGGDTEDITYVTYSNAEDTLTFNIYSDGTVEIIDFALTYEKTDDTITFSKNGEAVYSIGYTLEDDSYTIYGEAYDTALGDPENDGYLANVYMYYADNTYLDFYLYDDTNAGLTMCYFYDPASSDLVLTLPNGDNLTYDIEMSEDATTVTLWGITLTLEVNEF